VELPPGWRKAHEVQPHMRRSLTEHFRARGPIPARPHPVGPFLFQLRAGPDPRALHALRATAFRLR